MSDSLKYWQDLACAKMKELHSVKKIRLCEGDAAAQVMLARYAQKIAYKDGLERAATLCDEYAEAGVTGAMVCAAAIRAMKVEK